MSQGIDRKWYPPSRLDGATRTRCGNPTNIRVQVLARRGSWGGGRTIASGDFAERSGDQTFVNISQSGQAPSMTGINGKEIEWKLPQMRCGTAALARDYFVCWPSSQAASRARQAGTGLSPAATQGTLARRRRILLIGITGLKIFSQRRWVI